MQALLPVELVADEGFDRRELRMALLWASFEDSDHPVKVTDDMPVPADGPLFDFEITQFPGQGQRRIRSEDDGPISVGNLLVYRDRNGDGKLTFTKSDSTEFRDDIVGWTPGIDLVFAIDPQEPSEYWRGLNQVSGYQLAPSWEQAHREPGTRIPIYLFDLPETQCLAMSPPVQSLPLPLWWAVEAIEEWPSRWSIYRSGYVDCGVQLPDDWWSIDCRDDSYLVTRVHWPENEDIAEQCGWLRSYCLFTVEADSEAPKELPRCE